MGQIDYEERKFLFLCVVNCGLAQSTTLDLNDPQYIPVLIFSRNICAGPPTVKPDLTFRAL